MLKVEFDNIHSVLQSLVLFNEYVRGKTAWLQWHNWVQLLIEKLKGRPYRVKVFQETIEIAIQLKISPNVY